MQIPYKPLTLTRAGLVAEGLLVAEHGPNGGYRLARPPTDLTLLDIVEAAEGPVTFKHCVLRDGPCDWEGTCPGHDTWSQAQNALATQFGSTPFTNQAGSAAPIQTD